MDRAQKRDTQNDPKLLNLCLASVSLGSNDEILKNDPGLLNPCLASVSLGSNDEILKTFEI